MRRRFVARERIAGPQATGKAIQVEPPPELSRAVESSPLKKSVPWVMGAAMLGIFGFMFISGQLTNPLYLVFMGVMIYGVIERRSGGGSGDEMSTDEVNSERMEYLRYLSDKRKMFWDGAAKQRAASLWSHPDPQKLEFVPGTRRQWERSSSDPDYLHVRIGRDAIKPLSKVAVVKKIDSELDLEPITKTAFHQFRTITTAVPDCPITISLGAYSLIRLYSDAELFASILRAWMGQLVCLHSPSDVAVAVCSADLEQRWGLWLKWCQHATDPVERDAVGPSRYMADSLDELRPLVASLMANRATISDTAGAVDAAANHRAHRHAVIIIDDPDLEIEGVRAWSRLAGVSVIVRRAGVPQPPDRPGAREAVLRAEPDTTTRPASPGAQPGTAVASSATHDGEDFDAQVWLQQWNGTGWKTLCINADTLGRWPARRIGLGLAHWEVGVSVRAGTAEAATASLLGLLGIENAAALDVEALWAQRRLPVGTGAPVNLGPVLRVPLGLAPDGSPVWLDFKDEAEGGNGPHGLMVGMTGSGKSKMLVSTIFSVLVTHSPDEVQFLLGDFKGEAEFDQFSGFPHVLAIISNMADKQALVYRFGELMLGFMEQRETHLREYGKKFRGAGFASVYDYNQARATSEGGWLPALPYLLVIMDEFSLLLKDHPELVDVFDTVCRKGRSLHINFLFASQTLDAGVIKQIPDNTNYSIGLKVASQQISSQVIGRVDAFHIEGGPHFKGTGFFLPTNGAEPKRFRSFLLPARYDPPVTTTRQVIAATPRPYRFTAATIAAPPDQVIETRQQAPTVLSGPPRSLVLTVGEQLAAAVTEKSAVWAPPLDDPIPLNAILAEAANINSADHRGDTPAAPWWPLGKVDRPRLLRHDLLTYRSDADNNMLLVGSDPEELSAAVQTFILSGASRYPASRVGFYVLAYGGAALHAMRELPHLGAVGGKDRRELSDRIFTELTAVAQTRRRAFAAHDVVSLDQYRSRRADNEHGLNDGWPVDIWVVVDGFEPFRKDGATLISPTNPRIADLVKFTQDNIGIHVVITTSSVFQLADLTSRLTTKYEFTLADATQSIRTADVRKIRGTTKPQDLIPRDQPLRAINSVGETIRFAHGRIDDTASIDGLDAAITHTTATIAATHTANPVRKPRMLPTLVTPDMLHNSAYGGECFPIGIGGPTLQPVVIDFEHHPLLVVYGDDKHGKTGLLRHLIGEITARRSGPEQLMCAVCDPKRALGTPTVSLLVKGMRAEDISDYYETGVEEIVQRVAQLGVVLAERKPPADIGANATSFADQQSWVYDGARIYVLIDETDAVPKQSSNADGSFNSNTWQPLLAHITRAHNLGLRVIVTRRAQGAFADESAGPTTLIGALTHAGATRILLGSRANDKVGGIPFEPDLIPGRGYMIAASSIDDGYIQLAPTPPAMLTPR